MPNDEITIGEGTPFPVRITGLRKAQAALRKAGADMGDMSSLMHEIGQLVVDDAASSLPVKSGRLKGTLRAGRGKTKAVVRMGSKRVPYAGVLEYGRGKSYNARGKFVNPARERDRARINSTFAEGIARILHANALAGE